MKTTKIKNYKEISNNFTGISEYPDGTKQWFLNGKLHREDGPAIKHPCGEKHWYLNGERHREDGPAIVYPNGIKYWWLYGYNTTKKQHKHFSNVAKLGYPKKIIQWLLEQYF